MSDFAIRVENLGKQYHIGALKKQSDRLGNQLADMFIAPFRRTSKMLRGRAHSAAELDEWEERMDAGGISFIEWADRLGAHLPQRAVRVTLRHRDTWDRAIEIAAPEAWLQELESTLPNELREPCNRDRPGH